MQNEEEVTESEFVADISDQLYEIFVAHPEHTILSDGSPQVPGHALLDILREFAEQYDGTALLDSEQESGLVDLLAQNPTIDVSPSIILGFVAAKAKDAASSPSRDQQQRGRRSRAGSRSSRDASMIRATPSGSSRPPSRGPPPSASIPTFTIPATPTNTAFEKRQRNAPIAFGPPSSWNKPTPASRRKSVDGGRSGNALSDSESPSTHVKGHRTSRSNSTTNPPPLVQSNSEPLFDASSGPFSPPSFSRPGSRGSSRPASRQGRRPGSSRDYDYDQDQQDRDYEREFFSSPEPQHTINAGALNRSHGHGHGRGPSPLDLSELNSIAMPSAHNGEESDDDDDDSPSVPVWSARAGTMSTVSMEEEARIQALTISVEDLTRKLREAEETLSRRMYEHEGELEDLTARLEEAKFDLAASRREEKELRAKERSGTGQIAGLEAEVARLGKALEASRASYSGLNRQYQEQCAEAERVRNQLRGRDAELKDLRDAAGLVSLETGKWGRERENYDERIVGLEADLAAAAAAHAALEDQKQENMMLKETIDRLRFEMDELRTAAAAAGSGKDAAASREATMSRSLGAEMQRMIGDEKWEDGDGDDSADTETVVGTPGPGEDEGSGSGSEDEIETQTIITRKKKKTSSRANKVETIRIEETKEYSDAYTQYDVSSFATTKSAQTDPEPVILKESFSMQTDIEEPTPVIEMEIQTDPEPIPTPPPAPVMMSMEIQTDPEPEPQAEPEPEPIASTSTAAPPTPKGKTADLPPTYEEDERALAAASILQKAHPGAPAIFTEGLPNGISAATLADWVRIKSELGVSCAVLDRLVESSTVQPEALTPEPASALTPEPTPESVAAPIPARKWTLSSPLITALTNTAANVLLCMAASGLVVLVMGPTLAPPPMYVPGGPTYYDRLAWSSFNGMQAAGEGFGGGFGGGDGTGVVWNVIGRLGGGAARRLGGWPT